MVYSVECGAKVKQHTRASMWPWSMALTCHYVLLHGMPKNTPTRKC